MSPCPGTCHRRLEHVLFVTGAVVGFLFAILFYGLSEKRMGVQERMCVRLIPLKLRSFHRVAATLQDIKDHGGFYILKNHATGVKNIVAAWEWQSMLHPSLSLFRAGLTRESQI